MKSHEDGHVSSSGFIGHEYVFEHVIQQSKLGKYVESTSTAQKRDILSFLNLLQL